MIVVDTNVIVYLFVSGERTELAKELLLVDGHWIVPPLWKSEFRNAVIQSARQGVITFQDARLFAQRAEAMFHQREIDVSGHFVIDLAHDSACSGYDCEFVALALQLDTVLVTVDKRVLKEFPAAAVALDEFVYRNRKNHDND
jgi:predicted nucleic acid-binding protein